MKTRARRFAAKIGPGRKKTPLRKGRHFGIRKGQKHKRTGIPQVRNRSGVRYFATIRSDEVYSLEQFVRMTGLGPSALRRAELDGLRTAFIGNRKQISGAAWLEYVRKKEVEQTPKRAGNREPDPEETNTDEPAPD